MGVFRKKKGQKACAWILIFSMMLGIMNQTGQIRVDAAVTRTVTIDFEDGSNGGFRGRGSAGAKVTSENAYSGNSLLVTGRVEYWSGAEKDLTDMASGGAELEISAYVRNNEDHDITVNMVLQEEKGEGSTEYNWIQGEVMIHAGEWRQLSGEIVMNQKTTAAVLYFESANAEASFSIDQVVITVREAKEEPPGPTPVLEELHPVMPFEKKTIDFEDGSLFFTNRGDAKGGITEDAHSGTYALRVTGRAQSWHGVEKDLTEAGLSGKGLQVTYWAKNIASVSTEIILTLQETDGEGKVTYHRVAGGEAAPGQWVRLSGSINIQPETVQPVIYFESSDAAASFLIDDITMEVIGWIRNDENGKSDGKDEERKEERRKEERQEDGNPDSRSVTEAEKNNVPPFERLVIDFENGETFFDNRGDAKGSVTDRAHGGQKALAVTGRTETWHGVGKSLEGAKIAGRNLAVTFWARNDSLETMEIILTLQEEATSGEIVYSRIAGEEAKPGEWVELGGNIDISEDTVRPEIYFESSDKTAAFCMDDIVLTVGAVTEDTVQPFESMKIDFENGGIFFDNRGSAKATITTDAHESEKALAVSGRSEAWHGVEKDFTGTGLGGNMLKVSFWVKHDEYIAQEIILSMQEEDKSGEIMYNRVAGAAEVPAGEWVEITGEYQVDPEAVKNILYFEAMDPSAAFIIDDVELTVVKTETEDKSGKENKMTAGSSVKREEREKSDAPNSWLWLLAIPGIGGAGGGIFFFRKRKRSSS